jgi:hypothetical protein
MKIPTVHIYGSVGDRAAVLVKFPTARPVATGKRGEKYPIYGIRAAGKIIAEGHGVTDAWHEAAKAIYI